MCILSYLDFNTTAVLLNLFFYYFEIHFSTCGTLCGFLPNKSQSVKPIFIVVYSPLFFLYLSSFVDPPSLTHTSNIFGSLVGHRSSRTCPFTPRLEDINIIPCFHLPSLSLFDVEMHFDRQHGGIAQYKSPIFIFQKKSFFSYFFFYLFNK